MTRCFKLEQGACKGDPTLHTCSSVSWKFHQHLLHCYVHCFVNYHQSCDEKGKGIYCLLTSLEGGCTFPPLWIMYEKTALCTKGKKNCHFQNKVEFHKRWSVVLNLKECLQRGFNFWILVHPCAESFTNTYCNDDATFLVKDIIVT